MKFLVDMALSPSLAGWLQKQGHDAVHAAELGLSRAPDLELMDRAIRDGRAVVTADLDYPRLLALARSASPSLILFRDGNWSDAEIIFRMDEILRTLADADIAQSIVVVERNRVRRRRLPIDPISR